MISSPKPPDPYQTAQAQAGADKDASITSSLINNVNERTPYGSVDYTNGAGRTYTDSSGKTVTVPTTTRTVSLTPEQQKILDLQNKTNIGLGNLANTQVGKLQGALNKPFVSAGSLPKAGGVIGAPGLDTRNITAKPMQTQIADAGAIKRDYGPTDYSEDRKRVEDAFLARSNDQFAKDDAALDTKLRNQGLAPGSEAYNTQYDQLRRQRNDQTNQAILYGGQEQSRLAGLAKDAATFTNDAQAQQFGQNQARGLFTNSAQQSNFDNSLTSRDSYNAARTGQYSLKQGAEDAKTARRARSLEEAFALRQQPINESLALASGTQLNVPQFSAPYQQGVSGAPIADLIQQGYQSKLQSKNGMASGLFGLLGNLGAAGIMASDRRLKTEIRRLGTLFADVGLYRYKLMGKDQIGVIAQEVQKVLPSAVHKIGGMLFVDYGEVTSHAG